MGSLNIVNWNLKSVIWTKYNSILSRNNVKYIFRHLYTYYDIEIRKLNKSINSKTWSLIIHLKMKLFRWLRLQKIWVKSQNLCFWLNVFQKGYYIYLFRLENWLIFLVVHSPSNIFILDPSRWSFVPWAS